MIVPFGTLYLVPNALDFGTAGPLPDLRQVLPLGVIETAAALTHWVAENAKTTRAFLKRVDAVIALGRPLQAVDIVELPRPQKGSAKAAQPSLAPLLSPALAGADVGLISEAGLPAVADPGAMLVQTAHALGIRVVPLAGPCSLVLALAASGLHGQSFAFVGYLPVDAAERAARIIELEVRSRRQQQTQLMIETPYRNPSLLGALLVHLHPKTQLAVSCGLTLRNGYTRSQSAADWKSSAATLPADIPAVFSFLAD